MCTDRQGYTALQIACCLGLTATIGRLLKNLSASKNLLDHLLKRSGNQTAFMLACISGHTTVSALLNNIPPDLKCQYLLKADLEEAFITACKHDHVATAVLILSLIPAEKIEFLYRCQEFTKMFDHVCTLGFTSIVQLILDNIPPQQTPQSFILIHHPAFRYACGSGHIDIAALLLNRLPPENHEAYILLPEPENYADEPQTEESGETALMRACSSGNVQAVSFLFSQLPAPSRTSAILATDYHGSTALARACESNYPPVICMVVDELLKLLPDESSTQNSQVFFPLLSMFQDQPLPFNWPTTQVNDMLAILLILAQLSFISSSLTQQIIARSRQYQRDPSLHSNILKSWCELLGLAIEYRANEDTSIMVIDVAFSQISLHHPFASNQNETLSGSRGAQHHMFIAMEQALTNILTLLQEIEYPDHDSYRHSSEAIQAEMNVHQLLVNFFWNPNYKSIIYALPISFVRYLSDQITSLSMQS